MNSEENHFYPTITIRNFKIFQEEVSFELKPITILVGPNGGGKSTIIEALEFFLGSLKTLVDKDSDNMLWFNSFQFSDIACTKDNGSEIILSSRTSQFHSLRNTENESISREDDEKLFEVYSTIKLYLKNSSERIIIDRLDILAEDEKLRWMVSIYPNKIKHDLKEVDWIIKFVEYLNQLFDNTWIEYLKNQIEDYKSGHVRFFREFDIKNSCCEVSFKSVESSIDEAEEYIFKMLLGTIFFNINEYIVEDLQSKKKQELYLQVIYMILKENYSFFNHITPKEFTDIFEDSLRDAQQILLMIKNHIDELHLWETIDETRENPPAVFEYKSGKFINDYYGLCSFLLKPIHKTIVFPEYQEINHLNELNKILIDFDIADSVKLIEIATVSPNHKYYKINLVKGNVEFNIASLSSGGKQLIPIILSLINHSDPPDNIAIKQPELHLHPKLQMKLADLICYNFPDLDNTWAIYRIVETHSEHLIRRLQILVAKKKIGTDDIGVLYISNDEVKNYSKLIKLEMDDKGLFTTPWPSGFFEESSILNIQLIEEILKRAN